MERPPSSEREQSDRQLQALLQRSQQKERRRGVTAIIGAVVVVAVAGAGFLLYRAGTFDALLGGGGLPGLLTSEAPWPANAEELGPRLDEIGLPRLTREEQALHLHPVLRIRVDGNKVPVPANVGIDPGTQFLSPIHTHDATGTIHVESPEVRDFTLGEFFDVWGVRLDAECIGGHCGDLQVLSAGEPVRDPRAVVLADGQQVLIKATSG